MFLVATTAHSEADALPDRMLEHALGEGMELRGPAYTTYLPANGAGERLLQIAVGVRRKE